MQNKRKLKKQSRENGEKPSKTAKKKAFFAQFGYTSSKFTKSVGGVVCRRSPR